MDNFSTVLIFVFCCNLLLLYAGFVNATECIKTAECQCVIKGTKHGINLNGISTTNTSTFNETGIDVIFNPCNTVDLKNVNSMVFSNRSITIVDNGCNDTSSICLVLVDVKLINLGTFDQLQYGTEANGTVYLHSFSKGWSYKILLECGTDDADKLTLVSQNITTKKLELKLSSKKACLTEDVVQLSESGWKTFFIIIFVIIVVYFLGGVLFRKVFFNASGIELLPNHLFWINVIESLVDLLKYISNGCRRPSSYDQI